MSDTDGTAVWVMPPNTVRVNLPHSEVCMHMQLAGQDHWVAKVDKHAAQIYRDNGERFSAPILLSLRGTARLSGRRVRMEGVSLRFRTGAAGRSTRSLGERATLGLRVS
jgi:hypothetical protein